MICKICPIIATTRHRRLGRAAAEVKVLRLHHSGGLDEPALSVSQMPGHQTVRHDRCTLPSVRLEGRVEVSKLGLEPSFSWWKAGSRLHSFRLDESSESPVLGGETVTHRGETSCERGHPKQPRRDRSGDAYSAPMSFSACFTSSTISKGLYKVGTLAGMFPGAELSP
jgi:hypothetical protein